MADSSTVASISPQELAELLQQDSPPLLLDCREPVEWGICRIDGARHIPMHEVAARLTELDPDRPIVVYCHHGIRSHTVAKFLTRHGFAHVANLVGGVDAWSTQVDPTVPRY